MRGKTLAHWIENSRVINGNRNVVEVLEEALAKAKAGEIEGVAIAYCSTDGFQWVTWAINNGMLFAWSRLYSAVQQLATDLMNTDGM